MLNWIDDEAVLDRFASALAAAAERLGNSFERPEPAYFIVRSHDGRVVIVRDRGSLVPRPQGLMATAANGAVLAEYDLAEGGWAISRSSTTSLSDEEVAEHVLALAGM